MYTLFVLFYIGTMFLVLLIIAAVIVAIFEACRQKRYDRAAEIALQRKKEEEMELERIGIRLMNTPPKVSRPEPIRKVCGIFAGDGQKYIEQ